MSRALRQPRHFDPDRYRSELVAIIGAIAAAPGADARGLDRILKRHPKDGRGLFARSEVIAGFRRFAAAERWPLEEAVFLERLRLRPVRTLSGVTPLTVLTRPHPCPGRCIFCPNDVHMPKSYLSDEPGAQRAEDNHFDPYLQAWNRLDAYRRTGHPVEKVELIVLGGTWSFHPEPYQVWFVKRCLDALCDFGAGRDGRAAVAGPVAPFDEIARAGSYNRSVGGFLARSLGEGLRHLSEDADWCELEAVQRANEGARCRLVGLSVETRPDHLDAEEVLRLRRLGVTKVQVGIQSLSDPVLAANRRGHGAAASRAALRRLRAAGLKIHAHWMPNLLGATPESDLRDFERLFDDPALRPDELKIYPCLLVESAELARHHASGAWRPYPDDVLLDLVCECLARTPPWCRVTRVIRDFAKDDVAAGTHRANLREGAERRLRAEGRPCRDIRAREVRGAARATGAARLSEISYASAGGRERFLELLDPEERLLGFLRLALPSERSFVRELGRAAVIRELHVYGASLPLGARRGGAAQHAGLGRRLVAAAEARAREAGHDRLAVISAVGTRGYYRALGFRDGALYQHRDLPAAPRPGQPAACP